jgi:hypothetical protein
MRPHITPVWAFVAFWLAVAAAIVLTVAIFAPGDPERGEQPTTTEAGP